MKHLVQIVFAVLLSCVIMSSTPAVKPDLENKTIENFIKSLPNRLDVEYKISVDTQVTSQGYKNGMAYKTPLIVITPYKNGRRDGTQFTLFPIYPMTGNKTWIENKSIKIKEMRNFRNDSLTGSLLWFDYTGDLSAMILNIKENTDFLYDQYLEYGDTTAVIYQGFYISYDYIGNIEQENWAIFTENNTGIDRTDVAVGYAYNRNETIDYSKVRCLLYRGDIDSTYFIGD